MRKFLLLLGFCMILSQGVEARPHHMPQPPRPYYYMPVHHHHHSNRAFWNTFAGAVVGSAIGTYIVRDSYITYNQRANVPQNCVTMVNQYDGSVMTQCSQNANQVIYVR